MAAVVNKWVAVIVVGAISAIMAVGCGGGDDSTTALTKAEFTKEANLICTKSRWEVRAAAAKMNRRYYEIEGVDTNSEAANLGLETRLTEQMVNQSLRPVMKRQLESFEELGAPADDEAEVARMVETYSEAIEELEDRGVVTILQFKKMDDFKEEAAALGLNCGVSYLASPG